MALPAADDSRLLPAARWAAEGSMRRSRETAPEGRGGGGDRCGRSRRMSVTTLSCAAHRRTLKEDAERLPRAPPQRACGPVGIIRAHARAGAGNRKGATKKEENTAKGPYLDNRLPPPLRRGRSLGRVDSRERVRVRS